MVTQLFILGAAHYAFTGCTCKQEKDCLHPTLRALAAHLHIFVALGRQLLNCATPLLQIAPIAVLAGVEDVAGGGEGALLIRFLCS